MPNARLDNLATYFKHKIKIFGFIDVEPLKMAPTWRNNRLGATGVGKGHAGMLF
jgi:hypothetical protein